MKSAKAWMVLVALLGMGLAAAPAAEPPAGAVADEAMEVAAGAVKKVHTGLLPDAVAKPFDWFEWGADLRVRQVYFNNIIDLNQATDDENLFFRVRHRLWTKITPAKDIEIGVRLVGEWRSYCIASGSNSWECPDEYLVDKLYFQWKNIGGGPVSIKVGRQDLVYGKRWLIFEGTPLDGSRTIFFDALKVTVDLGEKTKLDLVWFGQHAAHTDHLCAICDQGRLTAEYDVDCGVLGYLTHKFSDEVNLDLYYMHVDLTRVVESYPHANDLHTAGGRVYGRFANGFSYSVEAAGQWGEATCCAGDTCALGVCAEAKYEFDHEMKPEVHVQVECLSGNNPNDASHGCFTPHFARWPQWSELYIYSYLREVAIAEVTNLQRYQIGGSVKLTPNTKLLVNYNDLKANETPKAGMPGFSTGSTRGHLVQAKLNHKFNDWLSGHLLFELFCPGDYYSDPKSPACFARWELEVKF